MVGWLQFIITWDLLYFGILFNRILIGKQWVFDWTSIGNSNQILIFLTGFWKDISDQNLTGFFQWETAYQNKVHSVTIILIFFLSNDTQNSQIYCTLKKCYSEVSFILLPVAHINVKILTTSTSCNSLIMKFN